MVPGMFTGSSGIASFFTPFIKACNVIGIRTEKIAHIVQNDPDRKDPLYDRSSANKYTFYTKNTSYTSHHK